MALPVIKTDETHKFSFP